MCIKDELGEDDSKLGSKNPSFDVTKDSLTTFRMEQIPTKGTE